MVTYQYMWKFEKIPTNIYGTSLYPYSKFSFRQGWEAEIWYKRKEGSTARNISWTWRNSPLCHIPSINWLPITRIKQYISCNISGVIFIKLSQNSVSTTKRTLSGHISQIKLNTNLIRASPWAVFSQHESPSESQKLGDFMKPEKSLTTNWLIWSNTLHGGKIRQHFKQMGHKNQFSQ